MNKVQAEFIKEDVIRKLGGQYDKINPNDYPILERILMASGLEFNKQVTANLNKTNSISSGKLADTEVPIIKMFGNKYVLEIGYENGSDQSKYYSFVDKGVRGTKNIKADVKSPYAFKTGKKSIPVSVVKKWLSTSNKKSISVKKYTKLGVEAKSIDVTKSLPFMIARSIHTKGLTSTHYYSDALKLVFGKEFKDAIQVALGAEINIKVIQIWNNKLK
jgi:hypothetical protein